MIVDSTQAHVHTFIQHLERNIKVPKSILMSLRAPRHWVSMPTPFSITQLPKTESQRTQLCEYEMLLPTTVRVISSSRPYAPFPFPLLRFAERE